MNGVGDGETVAVDTAVWMDGLLLGGASEELVMLGVSGRVHLVTSEVLLGELADVLQRGLDFSTAASAEVLRFVRDVADVHDDLDAAPAAVPRNTVIEVARRAGAACVATTDRSPLASLPGHPPVPVITIT